MHAKLEINGKEVGVEEMHEEVKKLLADIKKVYRREVLQNFIVFVMAFFPTFFCFYAAKQIETEPVNTLAWIAFGIQFFATITAFSNLVSVHKRVSEMKKHVKALNIILTQYKDARTKNTDE